MNERVKSADSEISGEVEKTVSRQSDANVISSIGSGSENISKQLDNVGTRTFDRLYSFDESSKESDKPNLSGLFITSYA